jgi:hypothetical protein
MNPAAPHTTASLAARRIRVRFVNDFDNSQWGFLLRCYLAERLPCLQTPSGPSDRTGGLRWDVEQLGPIEPSDAQTLRALERLSPPVWKFRS